MPYPSIGRHKPWHWQSRLMMLLKMTHRMKEIILVDPQALRWPPLGPQRRESTKVRDTECRVYDGEDLECHCGKQWHPWTFYGKGRMQNFKDACWLRLLMVLTALIVLTTNKTNIILLVSKLELEPNWASKEQFLVTKLDGCSFQAPHCLIWT